MPRVSAVPNAPTSGVPTASGAWSSQNTRARMLRPALPWRGRRRQDIPALDEQLAIEGDADGLTGARLARCSGLVRHRPGLDRLNDGEFCARHDPDFIANGDAAAFRRGPR